MAPIFSVKESICNVQNLLTKLFLNPASLATACVISIILSHREAKYSDLFNPWSISFTSWFAFWILYIISLVLLEANIWLLAPFFSKLPSREKSTPQNPIRFLDQAFITMNTIVGYIFTSHVSHLLWYSPIIDRVFKSFGFFNGLASIWLLFMLDDLLYVPLHWFMHIRSAYKWVHKHHHQSLYPARAYLDASNNHPVEHIWALTLNYLVIHMVGAISGVHIISIFSHFTLKALFSLFNHTECDLKFSFLGIEHSVQAHEMHHRIPQSNYAQFVSLYDQILGTHIPYKVEN